MANTLERQSEYLQFTKPDLQIGRDTLRAHGQNETDPVVITSHFATPPDGEFTSPVDQDVALEASMTYSCLGKGEIGLGPQLPEWFKKYAQKTGLHPVGTHYVEVPYAAGGDLRYPKTDPLWQAQQQGIPLPYNAYYITTFPHQEGRILCQESKLQPLQTFDPVEVGNKSFMRQYFEMNGYPNIPFKLIHTYEDLAHAIELLQQYQSPRAWIKVMRSSGGEGVARLDIEGMQTQELWSHLIDKCTGFRELAESVYGTNGYADLLNDYWIPGSFTPEDGILIECDASVMGEPGPSSSNIMIVPENGPIHEVATFTQIVDPDGKFLGSTLVEKTNRDLPENSQLARLGHFARSRGFRGIMGADYFPGNDQIIEGNMRVPFSGYALLAFQNLETQARRQGMRTDNVGFAQSTIHFPAPIRSLEDLQQYVGEWLYTGEDPEQLRRGAIVPWRIASAVMENNEPLDLGDVGILVTAEDPEIKAEILSIAKRFEE